MMPRRGARWLAASFTLVATACAPEAADAEGRAINDLYDVFSVVAAVVFLTTAGLIAWSILRFRARPGDDALPTQFHQNVGLELLWFAIPQVIVIVLFLLSVQTLDEVDRRDPDPGVTVGVQGFQWGWRFSYGDGVEVVGNAQDPPELVLPVDTPVSFVLTSNDVIHSFYVPEFLMKRDTIPGRENRFDITIEEEGVYDGKCAEFCGLLHGDMNFTVRAVPGDEFERWIAEQGGRATN